MDISEDVLPKKPSVLTKQSPCQGQVQPLIFPLMILHKVDLGQLLGKGGYGEVYSLKSSSIDKPETLVAKIAFPTKPIGEAEYFFPGVLSTSDPLIQRMFPRVVGRGIMRGEKNRNAIIMDKIQGITLRKVMKDDLKPGPFGLGAWSKLDLCIHISRAVRHMHSRGVAHQDLKPDNIMVVPRSSPGLKPRFEAGVWDPVIIDFGLACLTHSSPYANGAPLKVMFRKRIAGTPRYMAPELPQPEIYVDPLAADIYSLGVIIYQLFSKTTPFLMTDSSLSKNAYIISKGTKTLDPIVLVSSSEAPSEGNVPFQRVTRFTALREGLGGLQDSINRIIVACTDKNPKVRPTADELCLWLEECQRKTLDLDVGVRKSSASAS
jgi:serine/threonine protein kinase